jgi:hypothetical protein
VFDGDTTEAWWVKGMTADDFIDMVLSLDAAVIPEAAPTKVSRANLPKLVAGGDASQEPGELLRGAWLLRRHTVCKRTCFECCWQAVVAES